MHLNYFSYSMCDSLDLIEFILSTIEEIPLVCWEEMGVNSLLFSTVGYIFMHTFLPIIAIDSNGMEIV